MAMAGRSSISVSLKYRILLPLFAGLALLIWLFAVVMQKVERSHLEDSLTHDRSLFAAYQRDSMALRGEKLAATAEALARNRDIRSALSSGDRMRMMHSSEQVFHELQRRFNITHFYFIDNQRRVLLRVHNPDSFGDRLERTTAVQAEQTGQPAVGVELGKTASYTLRAVVPISEHGRTIGYIELGEEVLDSLLDLAKTFTDTSTYVLLYKRQLVREDWEQFMRILGRNPQWERYPEVVLAAQTQPDAPGFLQAMFARLGQDPAVPNGTTSQSGDEAFNVGQLPLKDARGREVGQLIVLRNVSAMHIKTRRELLLTITSTTIGGLVLGVFVYILLARTEIVLARAQEEVVEAAKVREIEQRQHIEELTMRINELERFERLTVGRELRIQALREENRQLRTAQKIGNEAVRPDGEGARDD